MTTMSHKIFVKIAGKQGRIALEDTNLQEEIKLLRETISTKVDIPLVDINLIYCGKVLTDDDTLEKAGVKPGCTVHVLKKRAPDPEPELEPMDDAAIRQLMTALHAALLNPGHRQAVHKILTSEETIDNIIAATPGMSSDPIAVSMLRDPQLLVQVADPENVKRIVRAHPAIGHAVMNIAASVNEEAALRYRSAAGSSSGTSDPGFDVFMPGLGLDEDMDTPGESSQSQRPGITAAQLTAALSAAGVGGRPESSASRGLARGYLRPYESPVARSSSNRAPPPYTPPFGGSRTAGSTPNRITSDAFQQALAQAMLSASNSPASPASNSSPVPPPPPPRNATTTGGTPTRDFREQLAQLRSMGITDERQSLRALHATEGDVQAALNLIFEGDI